MQRQWTLRKSFATEWVAYYWKKKRNHYHQGTKGILRHVFRQWYRQGKSLLKQMNIHWVHALPPVWDEWLERAENVSQRSAKRVLEAAYRGVKEEVRQYVAGPLGSHEWGIAIMYSEAVSTSRRGTAREEEAAAPQDNEETGNKVKH